MTRKNSTFPLKKALLIALLLVLQNGFAKELKWNKESQKRMNWYEATHFCKKQNARLPSYEEIQSVWLKHGKDSNIEGFDLSVSYWTSKEEKNKNNAAHPFYFGEGKKGWYYKADHYGVRCIKN
jgi:uncharacterized protein YneR